MAASPSRRAPVSSGKRILLLLGALVVVGIVYLSLPKSWFEIPVETPAASRKTLPGQPSPSVSSEQNAQSSLAERLASMRAEAAANPLDFGARSRYGMALAASGRSSEALREFQEAARLAPDAPGVHHNLAVYYLNSGQRSAADTEFCRELELAPGDGRAHFFRGLILQARHMDNEAIGQFREAIALAPQLPDAYLSLAMEMTRGNNEAQVRSLIENYVRLHGDKTLANYVLSGAYRTWKNYKEAARCAELTVQQSPENYGYWHNLGQIYSYSHRFDEADRALNRARELARDPTTPLIELGMNAQSAQRFESAETYFKNALAGSPKTGNIHFYLVHLYRQWRREPEARAEERLYRDWELQNQKLRRRSSPSTVKIRQQP